MTDRQRPLEPTAFTAALLVAAGFILLRSFVFVRFEQSYFDADQAITGLMAKHLAEGRAFPLFYYGQHYMLAVEAWLAAPLFALAGASVFTLKAPLVALNIVAAGCLMAVLLSDRRASLWTVSVAMAFFVLAPPIAASRLVEAQGGNIEPFVYIPLLWLTRRRPAWFGATAAIGILNRQFTLYGIVALALVALFNRRERPRARDVAVAALVFVLICGAIEMASSRADVLGPRTGTDGETMRAGAVGAVTKRIGWHPAEVPGNVRWLIQENFPALFGAPRVPQSEFIETTRQAAPTQVWWLLAAAFVVIGARVAILAVRGRRAGLGPEALAKAGLGAEALAKAGLGAEALAKAGLGAEALAKAAPCAYLMFVGAQAALVYAVAGTDVRANVLVRYTLLAMLFPIGLVAAHLMLEPRRRFARATAAVVGLWAVMSLVQHVQLAHEYLTDRPPNPHRQLVEYLRGRGIKYADADYWTAYTLTFLSNEELVVKSREKVRVEEYQRAVDEHDAEAVQIWRESGFCERETRVGPWFICGP